MTMTDTNPRAVAGDNNPPADDPIDAALAPWADDLAEIENWIDGEPIETVEQMEAVDALIKSIKTIRSKVNEARLDATRPLKAVWDAENERWKPTTEDLDRQQKCLVNLVAPIKKRLHDEAEAEKRRKWEEANQARREAEAAAAAAAAEGSNIDAEREAAAMAEAAKQADTEARKASKTKQKGTRTVHHHKVESGQAVINWIIENDRGAMQAFIAGYVSKATVTTDIAGVKRWTTQEAF